MTPPYAPPHAGAVDIGADGLWWLAGLEEKSRKLKWFRFPSSAQEDVNKEMDIITGVNTTATPAQRAGVSMNKFLGYTGGAV